MKTQWRVLLLVAGSGTLMGCPNPNGYGTPRTTPTGQVAHTLAIEGIHIREAQMTQSSGTAPPTTAWKGYSLPLLPTYQLRVGLHDRVDLGFRVANLDTLGLDAKLNFVKSTGFDVAFDPGVQFTYVDTVFVHLPFLVGINLSEAVTIVGSPGVLVVGESGHPPNAESLTSHSSLLGRFGLGLDVRTSRRFGIHPEVTAMKAFNHTDGVLIVFGLGLNFGAQPHYEAGSEDDRYQDTDTKPTTDSAAATYSRRRPHTNPDPAAEHTRGRTPSL